jgi:hypothetical protein
MALGYRITRNPAGIVSGTEAPETMVSIARLENVRACIETVLRDEVPGDFVETGAWRGGVVIFMRGVLLAHGVTDRTVWAADSFEGFPKHRRFATDRGQDFTGGFGDDCLRVDVDTVIANFDRYGLHDDQVRFIPGWFSQSLGTAPIDQLSVLRLDGDLYESTWDALVALEPKLAVGGFVIVDDYGSFSQCADAINDYRRERGIDDPIEVIDAGGVYWRKSRQSNADS